MPRRPVLREVFSAGLGRRRAEAALWRAAKAESPAPRRARMPAATGAGLVLWRKLLFRD